MLIFLLTLFQPRGSHRKHVYAWYYTHTHTHTHTRTHSLTHTHGHTHSHTHTHTHTQTTVCSQRWWEGLLRPVAGLSRASLSLHRSRVSHSLPCLSCRPVDSCVPSPSLPVMRSNPPSFRWVWLPPAGMDGWMDGWMAVDE